MLSVVCGLWSVVGCPVQRLQPNTDGLRKLNIGVRIGHDKGKVHAKFDVKGSKFKVTRPIDAVFLQSESGFCQPIVVTLQRAQQPVCWLPPIAELTRAIGLLRAAALHGVRTAAS